MSDDQPFGQAHQREHASPLFRIASATPFRFLPRCAAALCLLLASAGCGPWDARYDPSHFHPKGHLVPPDVIVPRDVRLTGTTGGLYVESAATTAADVCCWIGPHAAFLVRKKAGMGRLQISAYIPENDRFRSHGQKITIAFTGQNEKLVWKNMRVGFSRIVIPVANPLRMRGGPIRVFLDCAYYDTPPGPRNKTTPLYAALISSIYFE